jgi:hypothetical protein
MSQYITYNLFRSANDCTTICAVPQDRPVPAFIRSPAWIYDNSIWDTGVVPPGFSPHSAKSASELNGFYLFYLCRRVVVPESRSTQRKRSNVAALAA